MNMGSTRIIYFFILVINVNIIVYFSGAYGTLSAPDGPGPSSQQTPLKKQKLSNTSQISSAVQDCIQGIKSVNIDQHFSGKDAFNKLYDNHYFEDFINTHKYVRDYMGYIITSILQILEQSNCKISSFMDWCKENYKDFFKDGISEEFIKDKCLASVKNSKFMDFHYNGQEALNHAYYNLCSKFSRVPLIKGYYTYLYDTVMKCDGLSRLPGPIQYCKSTIFPLLPTTVNDCKSILKNEKINENFSGKDAFIYAYNQITFDLLSDGTRSIFAEFYISLFEIAISRFSEFSLSQIDNVLVWCKANTTNKKCESHLRTSTFKKCKDDSKAALRYAYYNISLNFTLNDLDKGYFDYIRDTFMKGVDNLDVCAPVNYCNHITDLAEDKKDQCRLYPIAVQNAEQIHNTSGEPLSPNQVFLYSNDDAYNT